MQESVRNAYLPRAEAHRIADLLYDIQCIHGPAARAHAQAMWMYCNGCYRDNERGNLSVAS